MTWSKLSDDFADRLDRLGLSDSAAYLHVRALLHCNRLLLDGRFGEMDLRKFTPRDMASEVTELVTAGVWTVVEPGVWQIDWSDQLRREQVEASRTRNRQRQQRFRDNAATNGTHNAVTNTVSSKGASRRDRQRESQRPDPSLKTGRGNRPICVNGRPVATDGSCCGLPHADTADAS